LDTTGTTFIVDQADLAFGGTVSGSGTTDILLAAGSNLNLTNVTLSGIEEIGTAYSLGTTFTVDANDLSVAGTVSGDSSANDTLVLKGTDFDLTSTVLSSIEILKATGAAAVTFTVDGDDLASGGSVLGLAGKDDTLTISGTTDFDLSHTTLSSVEHLLADTANAIFKVDQADLASGGTVEGLVGGTDVISAAGTQLDLTSTALVDIEQIHAGTTNDTTITITHSQLGGIDPDLTTISGSSGTDTLVVTSTSFDLTGTTLSSIEVLQAGSTSGTTFSVNAADLGNIETIIGNASTSVTDTLVVTTTSIDLSSTTLSSIETIEADNPSLATTFTIGGGQGGAKLDLHANSVIDKIAFTADYHVDITSAATIETSILSVDNFEDGTGGDKLDLNAVTKGTGTYQDIQSVIDFLHPATLQDALDLAANTVVGANAAVVQFDYDDGNGVATYVVVDNSSATTLTADDAVIKLISTHNATLTSGDNFIL